VTGGITGVRYYDLPGGGQVVRTGSTATDFAYALGDHHDTPTLYLDATAQKPTWRLYTPYGEERGTPATAPDNRGFLNKPKDTATGLTLVGARQYDPATGRFITADPVLEKDDPVQIGGYAYAGNNPVVNADPSGERIDSDGGSAWNPFSVFIGLLFRIKSYLQAAQNEVWSHARKGYDGKSYGKGKTVSGVYNRHTGVTKVGVSGGGFCAEGNCRPGYLTEPGELWLSAASTKERGSAGEIGLDDYGSKLYEKPVCVENCQAGIKAAGGDYAPGTALYKEGSNDYTRTSPWTRSGTSWLERVGEGTKPGAVLSKANGGLEGLARNAGRAGKVFRAAGPIGTVAAIGFDVYDVATAPPAKRVHVAAEAVGGLAGAALGGAVGAAIGGPVGAVVLGAVGDWAGRKAGGFIADLFG